MRNFFRTLSNDVDLSDGLLEVFRKLVLTRRTVSSLALDLFFVHPIFLSIDRSLHSELNDVSQFNCLPTKQTS